MKAHVTSALLLAAMTTTAIAGSKLTQFVAFDLTKGSARGSMADARNSADTVQYIGCQIEGAFASCLAVNSAGEQHSCSTNDPVELEAVRTIQDSSYLFFRWDANGHCFQITVRNDSRYAPK